MGNGPMASDYPLDQHAIMAVSMVGQGSLLQGGRRFDKMEELVEDELDLCPCQLQGKVHFLRCHICF